MRISFNRELRDFRGASRANNDTWIFKWTDEIIMKTIGMHKQKKLLINVASIIKRKSNNVPDFMLLVAAHVAALFSYYSDNYSSYNFNE